MPRKYSTLSFSAGKIWLITANTFGTSDSRRKRQAFGPASNVYATCKENSYMRCGCYRHILEVMSLRFRLKLQVTLVIFRGFIPNIAARIKNM
jgi:hypothetical protein